MGAKKNLLYGEAEPVTEDRSDSGSGSEAPAAPSREEILQGLEDRIQVLNHEIEALQSQIAPLETERDDALFAIRALKGEATPQKRKRATAAEVAERRNRIEAVYKDNPDTDPQTLADEFKVSLSTINADKSFLIQAGRLQPGKRGPKPR